MANQRPGYSSNMSRGVTAQFDVNVKRLTTNLSQDLPVALFGTSALQAGYQSVIPVPSGLTLTVTAGLTASDRGKVIFSYTDGTNTDIVEVTSTTIQYPELVSALNVDLLEYNQIKVSLAGNGSDVSQFNKSIEFAVNNLFGSKSRDTITPAAYVRSGQFQANQVDLPVTGKLDKETSFLVKVVPIANLEINFSMFVGRYVAYNAGSVLG